jgi:hyaluronan synthase
MDDLRLDGGQYGGPRGRRADPVPQGPRGNGPRAHTYEIPEVTFTPRRWLGAVPLVLIAGGSVLLHLRGLDAQALNTPWLLITWGLTLSFVLVQLVMSWAQKPITATRRQQARLAELRIAVVIPCYNEDPQILDRTIYSLFNQTRVPDHVAVTDDGSKVDYTEVRAWWEKHHPRGTEFTWIRQANAGKKHAQAAAFNSDPYADIFVTIDSDSALDRRAIQEGIKPFASRKIMSVAGLETAINHSKNLLTRAMSARSIAFQLFAMSAQSVAGGNVLINPGAFSLYRAPLIRHVLPAYLGETMFGVPVILGDDTMLTTFALCFGQAVHQPSAVSMPVYPEKLSHHLRQWTRWMRGSTIRTLWRLRYLPVTSYGWLYVLYTMWAFFSSVAISVAEVMAWPASAHLMLASIVALVVWPLAVSVRLATVRRSDQTAWQKLACIALLPAAGLWYLLVLRQIRIYGIATSARQSWVTRGEVEVRMSDPAMAGELA